MKFFLGIVGFVVFVGALMFIAWKSSAPPPQPAAPVAAGDAPPIAPAAEENKPGPLPALFVFHDDQTATPIALAGPRKKPALLHLWASWCGPCRAELPELLAFGKNGTVDVIAVSVDDHWPDVVRYFKGKIPSEIVWDKNITLERALGVENIPTTFVLNTKGDVVDRFDGAQNWKNPQLARAVADDLKN